MSNLAKVKKGKRGPAKGEGGTPKKWLSDPQIDQLQRLAQVGATEQEMATMCGLDVDTLKARMIDQPGVLDAIKMGVAEMRTSLRRKQVAIALKDGHASQGTMLVWCGKVILGQSDRVTVKMETPEDAVSVLATIFPDLDLMSLLSGEVIETVN